MLDSSSIVTKKLLSHTIQRVFVVLRLSICKVYAKLISWWHTEELATWQLFCGIKWAAIIVSWISWWRGGGERRAVFVFHTYLPVILVCGIQGIYSVLFCCPVSLPHRIYMRCYTTKPSSRDARWWCGVDLGSFVVLSSVWTQCHKSDRLRFICSSARLTEITLNW